MKLIFVILSASLLILTYFKTSHAGSSFPDLQTVENVDLSRYVGQWFEIARYPNSFQKNCIASSALYTLNKDGEIEVLNKCIDANSGQPRQAKGRAWIIDHKSNAKLKVSFFWPFRGDYWIIDLDKNYEYAVIGTPSRKYLWILARKSTMDDELLKSILQKAALQGFDPSIVIRSDSKAQ